MFRNSLTLRQAQGYGERNRTITLRQTRGYGEPFGRLRGPALPGRSRTIISLGLLLFLACPAHAAIAFVTGSGGTGAFNASSGTVNYAIALAAGNESVVVIAIRTTTSTVSSITDSQSNSYAFRAAVTQTNVRVELWSSTLTTAVATTDTLTITLSATSKFEVVLGGYSGATARGTTNTNTGNSTTFTIDLTTQDPNNFVVAGFAGQNTQPVSASVGNLRASGSTSGGAGSTNVTGALNDNSAASASLVTNTVTVPSGTFWAAAALELRSTTGGAPAPKRLTLLGVGD